MEVFRRLVAVQGAVFFSLCLIAFLLGDVLSLAALFVRFVVFLAGQFYKTIKDIEQRLGDADVQLESFIISNTPSATMKFLWGIDKKEMVGQHILFQGEDSDTYIQTMFSEMIT